MKRLLQHCLWVRWAVPCKLHRNSLETNTWMKWVNTSRNHTHCHHYLDNSYNRSVREREIKWQTDDRQTNRQTNWQEVYFGSFGELPGFELCKNIPSCLQQTYVQCCDRFGYGCGGPCRGPWKSLHGFWLWHRRTRMRNSFEFWGLRFFGIENGIPRTR